MAVLLWLVVAAVIVTIAPARAGAASFTASYDWSGPATGSAGWNKDDLPDATWFTSAIASGPGLSTTPTGHGGDLYVDDLDGAVNVSRGGFRFTAPTGTTIKSAELSGVTSLEADRQRPRVYLAYAGFSPGTFNALDLWGEETTGNGTMLPASFTLHDTGLLLSATQLRVFLRTLECVDGGIPACTGATAGNSKLRAQRVVLTMDDPSAPSAPSLSSTPDSSEWTNAATAAVSVDGADPQSGIDAITIGGGMSVGYTSAHAWPADLSGSTLPQHPTAASTTANVTLPAAGNVLISSVARNGAGATSPQASTTLKVDRVEPEAPKFARPTTPGSRVTAVDVHSGVASIDVTVGGAATTTDCPGSKSCTAMIHGRAGTTATVTVKDVAGNKRTRSQVIAAPPSPTGSRPTNKRPAAKRPKKPATTDRKPRKPISAVAHAASCKALPNVRSDQSSSSACGRQKGLRLVARAASSKALKPYVLPAPKGNQKRPKRPAISAKPKERAACAMNVSVPVKKNGKTTIEQKRAVGRWRKDGTCYIAPVHQSFRLAARTCDANTLLLASEGGFAFSYVCNEKEDIVGGAPPFYGQCQNDSERGCKYQIVAARTNNGPATCALRPLDQSNVEAGRGYSGSRPGSTKIQVAKTNAKGKECASRLASFSAAARSPKSFTVKWANNKKYGQTPTLTQMPVAKVPGGLSIGADALKSFSTDLTGETALDKKRSLPCPKTCTGGTSGSKNPVLSVGGIGTMVNAQATNGWRVNLRDSGGNKLPGNTAIPLCIGVDPFNPQYATTIAANPEHLRDGKRPLCPVSITVGQLSATVDQSVLWRYVGLDGEWAIGRVTTDPSVWPLPADLRWLTLPVGLLEPSLPPLSSGPHSTADVHQRMKTLCQKTTALRPDNPNYEYIFRNAGWQRGVWGNIMTCGPNANYTG